MDPNRVKFKGFEKNPFQLLGKNKKGHSVWLKEIEFQVHKFRVLGLRQKRLGEKGENNCGDPKKNKGPWVSQVFVKVFIYYF